MHWQDFWPLVVRVIGAWTGGMSGNAFVGDQAPLDVSFDAANASCGALPQTACCKPPVTMPTAWESLGW
jgi:hypothetical protein